MIQLTTPISEEEILSLHAGDAVELSGIATTGRDAAHKYMVERLIEAPRPLPPEDQALFEELQSFLRGGAIYHCGPILRQENDRWRFVSAGPTTSTREELYQDKVIAAFGVRVVIGKGGMGPRTLKACERHRAIYLHAIGGTGVYSAATVPEVLAVFKKEAFGLPEAFWKIRLERFAGIVTMDAHGRSLHAELAQEFDRRFAAVIGGR
jgi:fumarate hydratase class I